MTAQQQSLSYVRQAIDGLPAELACGMQVPLPEVPSKIATVVTAGIGASEGPARMLARLLADAGLAARFCPIAHLVSTATPADLLVVFSQGLSPNARLLLDVAPQYAHRWLVTSVALQTATASKQRALQRFLNLEFSCIVAPPTSEPQTLVRMTGPTVAMLIAMRIAGHLLRDARFTQQLAESPNLYQCHRTFEPLDNTPRGIITIGLLAEQVHAHRWKLLEALLTGDPPVWDVLQFAHGPLQAFHERDLTLLVLERGTGSPLLARLRDTLHPKHHRLIHVPSLHADARAFFEHVAAIDALLLQTLQATPRDLFNWPGRHGDAPLYGLGSDGSDS